MRATGKFVLYACCLAVAGIMLGYYWFGYVPRQREYFANLRFRTLFIVAGQLNEKIDSLSQSLSNASTDSDVQSSLSGLVPDLRYIERRAPVPKSTVTLSPDSDVVTFVSEQGDTADAHIRDIVAAFERNELFDDLLILESPSGRVLYQRTPWDLKALNLADILKPLPSGKGTPEAAAKDAAAVRTLRRGDTEYTLYLHPLAMKGLQFTVCGQVDSAKLVREARDVPPSYLLWFIVPVLILVLSGPFLKILMLTRTARLAFSDLALLAVFAAFAAAIATIAMTSWRPLRWGETSPDTALKSYAEDLNNRLVADIRERRKALLRLDAIRASDCGTGSLDSLLERIPEAPGIFKAAPFEFAFWTNSDGYQATKWTVRLRNTPRVSQLSEQHFRDIQGRNLWSLEDGPNFTVRSRLSPTTSQPITVLSIQSGTCAAEESATVSASLVAPLLSVSSPVVPPGLGFAVFEPDGKVLFHSRPERNLHENFFDEIDSDDRLRAAVNMRAEASASNYYRGHSCRIYTRPVSGIERIPWSIATFREMEPWQAVTGMIWGDTLILYTALMLLLILANCLWAIGARVLRGRSWSDQVAWILARLWPDASRVHNFRVLLRDLLILLTATLVLITTGAISPYRYAGWLLILCGVAPLAALVLAAIRLWQPSRGQVGSACARTRHHAYILCMSLCLLMISVVPTLGLVIVCRTFEVATHTAHWQQRMLSAIDQRQQTREQLISSSRGLSEATKAIIRAVPAFSTDLASFALPKAGVFRATTFRGKTAELETPWWHTLLLAIRPAVSRDAIESGTLTSDHRRDHACAATLAGPFTQSLQCAGANPVVVATALPRVSFGRGLWWWTVALALLCTAYAWNCLAFRKLYALDFRRCPWPTLKDLPARGENAHWRHLIVIGLPLSGKDKAVTSWLGFAPPRVRLCDSIYAPVWLKQTLSRLQAELEQQAGQAMAVSSGGSTSTVRTPRPPIVHISNLESRLSDPNDRHLVADLLERVVAMKIHDVDVRVIVTSAVDPIFHFDSVLAEERKDTYTHPLPEVELQRLSRLLHKFQRVGTEPDETPEFANTTLLEECAGHKALIEVCQEVEQVTALNRPDREGYLQMIGERARALYKLFWASCTRPEKLLLIQIAQTGMVNPGSLDTLEDLIRKRLIVPEVHPRVMNETFRRFLLTVEDRETVHKWETEAGEGSWKAVRNVLIASVVLSLLVVGFTQADALQTISTVLAGVLGAAASVTRVFDYFTGNSNAAPKTS